MNDLKAILGFKGERGYSAYEIAVQHGYEGTEQDWLATLGTSSHFTQDSVVYTANDSQTEFSLPSAYTSDSFVSVYVDGAKVNDTDGYTISNNNVVFESAVESGSKVEIVLSSMSTNSLPIVTTIDSGATDSTAPSAKSVYTKLSEISATIETVNSSLNTKITDNKTDAEGKITELASRVSSNKTNISNKQNTVLSGTTAPDNSQGSNGDIYLQYTE